MGVKLGLLPKSKNIDCGCLGQGFKEDIWN